MLRRSLLLIGLVALAGCQSQLMLMPTPEVLKDPQFDLFSANPEPMTSNTIATIYATTRQPASENSTAFFKGKEDTDLHFGYARVRIGPEGLDVSELIGQSTTEERSEEFAWTVVEAPNLGSTPRPTEAEPNPDLPAGFEETFRLLNEYIDENPVKELTIYVHGAVNTFNWSISQGAQFQYFTGDNALVLAFSWPSPGNTFGYSIDKRRSNRASADLAYLIELLAQHSSATKINLLAYSAGGRVVGRALTELGERYSDPEYLRLGQVYLTSSDQPLEEFINGLPKFMGLLEGLTVTAAVNDPVLGMAKITDGKIRLGAVGEGVAQKLNIDEAVMAQVVEIVNSDRMVLIDIQDVPAAHYKFTHGAWYDSSWVSTDVMATLLGGLTPQERALVPSKIADTTVWTFPADYVEQLKANLLERQEREGRAVDPQGP